MNYSYLLAIHATRRDLAIIPSIFNNVGVGHTLCELSDGSTDKSLWIIPDSIVEPNAVQSNLKTIAEINFALVATLSNPIKLDELVSAREVLSSVGLDSSNVGDERLSEFLTASVKGQPLYYMEVANRFEPGNSASIQIKLLQEHPHFSPAWLDQSFLLPERPEGREFTLDDFEIVTISKTEEVDEPDPPPPPPINS